MRNSWVFFKFNTESSLSELCECVYLVTQLPLQLSWLKCFSDWLIEASDITFVLRS